MNPFIPLFFIFTSIFNLISSPVQSSDSQYLSTQKTYGQVIKINTDSIVLDTSSGIRIYPLSNDAQFTQDNNAVRVSEINSKDIAQVVTDGSGKIIALDTFSSQTFELSKYILPTLTGLILLALLIRAGQKIYQKRHPFTQLTLPDIY